MRLRKVVFLLLTALLLACSVSALAECKLFWDSRNGQHRQVCRGCEIHKKPTYVTKKWENHSWELRGITWPSKVEPTNGVMPEYITVTWDRYNSMRICPVCGDKTEIFLNETEQRANLIKSTAVTCTTDGSYTYQQPGITWPDITLSPEKNYQVKALGHDWSNKNGRCARKGCNETCPHEAAQQRLTCMQGTDCAVCGEALPPLGHDWSNKDGRCARAGCTATCSHEKVQQKCMENVDCTVCGMTLPALSHELVPHPAQAATCTQPGWDAYDTCKNCDYVSDHKEFDALGHDCVLSATKASTCTELGWREYRCQHEGCEYRYIVDIPLLPHDLAHHDAKAATCTEPGWEAYDTCKNCDYVSDHKEFTALGHDLAHHDAKAATCTEAGWEAYDICKNCDYTTYEEIKPLEHWYSEWTPAANATHTATCLRGCGHSKAVACETRELTESLTFCPVCGSLSDGTRLTRIQATAKSAQTLKGELTVRTGTLDSGETIISVAFEIGGKLVKTNRKVRMTLPASVMNDGIFCLLNADGTEVPLTMKTQGENIVLMLNFKDEPVFVLHVHPAA